METNNQSETLDTQTLINKAFEDMDKARNWDEYIQSWNQYEQLLQLKQTNG